MTNSSFLASLVDKDLLCRLRDAAIEKCINYPIISKEKRKEIPATILMNIQKRILGTNTWRWIENMEELESIHPFLALRLRSYTHPAAVLKFVLCKGRHSKGKQRPTQVHQENNKKKKRKKKTKTKTKREKHASTDGDSSAQQRPLSGKQQTKKKKQKLSAPTKADYVSNGGQGSANKASKGSVIKKEGKRKKQKVLKGQETGN